MELRKTYPGVNFLINLHQEIGASILYSDEMQVPNDVTVETNQGSSSWQLTFKSVDFGTVNLQRGYISGLIESAVPSIYLPLQSFLKFKKEMKHAVMNFDKIVQLDHIYIPNVASYYQFTGSQCTDLQTLQLPNITFKIDRPEDGITPN